MAEIARIRPHLWFARGVREAAAFYASIFPNSRIDSVFTVPAETPAGPRAASSMSPSRSPGSSSSRSRRASSTRSTTRSRSTCAATTKRRSTIMLRMVKLDMAGLERAAAGEPALQEEED
jgi:hypothetical protein